MRNLVKENKVNLLTPYLIDSIIGDKKVDSITLKNFETNEIESYEADELLFLFGLNKKLGPILAAPPINIKDIGLTEFVQAMTHYPDCMVPGDAVQAYRNYYHKAKPFAKWDWGRPAPDWWKGYQGA